MTPLLILLQVSEPQAGNNIVQIITAVTGLVTAMGIIFNIYMTNRNRAENKAQLQEVAKGVDGITTKLIETKTTEAHAMGMKQATDAMWKTTADIQEGVNKGIDQERKEQAFRDQPSTQQKDYTEVKDEIIDVVEKKADETKEVVKEIPNEVLKKLPPK